MKKKNKERKQIKAEELNVILDRTIGFVENQYLRGQNVYDKNYIDCSGDSFVCVRRRNASLLYVWCDYR